MDDLVLASDLFISRSSLIKNCLNHELYRKSMRWFPISHWTSKPLITVKWQLAVNLCCSPSSPPVFFSKFCNVPTFVRLRRGWRWRRPWGQGRVVYEAAIFIDWQFGVMSVGISPFFNIIMSNSMLMKSSMDWAELPWDACNWVGDSGMRNHAALIRFLVLGLRIWVSKRGWRWRNSGSNSRDHSLRIRTPSNLFNSGRSGESTNG